MRRLFYHHDTPAPCKQYRGRTEFRKYQQYSVLVVVCVLATMLELLLVLHWNARFLEKTPILQPRSQELGTCP